VLVQETAKLAVVQGHLAQPALDSSRINRLETDRAKAEQDEAKARVQVSKAEMRLEKMRTRAPK
jgi:hypothetical protein